MAGERLNEVTAAGGKGAGPARAAGRRILRHLGTEGSQGLNVYRIIPAIPSGQADACHGPRARAGATGVISHSAGRRLLT